VFLVSKCAAKVAKAAPRYFACPLVHLMVVANGAVTLPNLRVSTIVKNGIETLKDCFSQDEGSQQVGEA
jgi:hypothetical protein